MTHPPFLLLSEGKINESSSLEVLVNANYQDIPAKESKEEVLLSTEESDPQLELRDNTNNTALGDESSQEDSDPQLELMDKTTNAALSSQQLDAEYIPEQDDKESEPEFSQFLFWRVGNIFPQKSLLDFANENQLKAESTPEQEENETEPEYSENIITNENQLMPQLTPEQEVNETEPEPQTRL